MESLGRSFHGGAVWRWVYWEKAWLSISGVCTQLLEYLGLLLLPSDLRTIDSYREAQHTEGILTVELRSRYVEDGLIVAPRMIIASVRIHCLVLFICVRAGAMAAEEPRRDARSNLQGPAKCPSTPGSL